MTTTKKIIIFVLVVIVALGLGYWFYTRNQNIDGAGGAGFGIKNFFPFGNPDDTSSPDGDNNSSDNSGSDSGSIFNNTSSSTIAANVPIQKLRKLWDKPVAGAVIWNKGTTSIVRFVEKATGNVYEAGSNSTQVKRLTNNTIPKIMRATWTYDGSGFLAQTIDENDTIETSFIKLKLTSSSTIENSIPYDVVISKLPTGIAEISVSPDSKKIFYYTAGQTAKGFVSNPDGTNPVQVYGNYLTEWIPTWFGANSILMSSKASFSADSSGFILNPNTKTLIKIYSDMVGGTSLARPDGKYYLLSSRGSLLIEDAATLAISPLNISTLTEKCTWNRGDTKFVFCGVPKSLSSNNLPDVWYQGTLSTDDLIQKINVLDQYKFVLVDLKQESKEQIDTENLLTDSLGNFLIFQNKLDQSLWMLDTI